MAIISCPECNAQISSAAKHCVKCGCEFIICKECGTPILNNGAPCKACGYVNAAKPETTATEKFDELVEQKDLQGILLKSKPDNTYFNILTSWFVQVLAMILPIAFFIIAIVKTVVWKNEEELLVLTYSETLGEIKAWYIISLLLFFLGDAYTRWLDIILKGESLEKWCRRNKIELAPFIEKEMSVDFSNLTMEEIGKASSNVNIAITALRYQKEPATKAAQIKQECFGWIWLALTGLFIIIFCIINTKNYMLYYTIGDLTGEGFSLSQIESWWLLVLAVITYLVKKIGLSSIRKQNEQKKMLWVKNHFPEYYENYNKYIKDFFQYSMSLMDEKYKK